MSVEPPATQAPAVTPRWSYHPASPRRLLARMELGDAKRLFAGKGGERWLVQAREGKAEAAPQLADEDLVAITKPDASTFAFIGAGGTVYTARTPLGPFVQVRRIDPAPMRVAAAGKNIVTIQWDGTVTRSNDAGDSFTAVPLQGARPFDVALAPDGRAMLLGFPERLWISRDGAATWSTVSTPTVGAGRVGLDANGSIIARGVLKSVVWSDAPGALPELQARPLALPPLELLTELQPGPSAAALASGHAVLSGTTYFEVARRGDEGPWHFARGELTQPIQWVPIPHSDECKHMAIGANGRRIVLACMSGARRGGVLFPSLRLMLSRDGGSTFSPRRPTSLVADEDNVSLAVLRDDTLIVSGACNPDARGICSPRGPIRLVPAKGSRVLTFTSTEASKLPAVVGRLGHVQVAEASGRLYATARLASHARLAILVSDDAGESFRAVPLDLSNTAVAQEHKIAALLQHMQPGKLSIGSDGNLSWVLHAEPGPIWLTLDAGGRVRSAHLGPQDVPLLEAVGMRGLAYGAEDGVVFESADGGGSFSPLTRLPDTPGTEEPLDIWCESGGCVFGEVFTRAGWGASGGGIIDRGHSGEQDDEKDAEPTSRTPIVCKVIDSAAGEIENVINFPTAGDAQRGPLAWSAVVVDPKTGAVQAAHATDSPAHAVRMVTLLPPVANAQGFALEATAQAEGAAALRYGFAASADGQPIVGSPMRRVDVAWENQFEGPPQRASIAAPGALRAGDVTPRGKGVIAQAHVGMLSVAPGGIHVCVHKQCDQPEDRISFLRGRGPTDTVLIPPWPESGLGGRSLPLSRHVMHVGDKHVPIALHQHRSVVLRAERQPDGVYAFPALGLSPWDSKQLGIREVTYWSHLRSDLVGLLHTRFHPTRGLASAHVLRFDEQAGVAKVLEVPSSRELSDPPAACTEEQRKNTFRMPAPMIPGTQHPVIIEHGGAKEVLHTRLAIMHGQLSSACAQVMDARSDESTNRHALIPVGAMDKSWLLARGNTKLQWYGMRCRFQPGAKVEGVTPRPSPPPSLSKVGASSRRFATEADCEAIFEKIVGFVGQLPPGVLGPARDTFKSTCQGKPVDMDCVRKATDTSTILSTCLTP